MSIRMAGRHRPKVAWDKLAGLLHKKSKVEKKSAQACYNMGPQKRYKAKSVCDDRR